MIGTWATTAAVLLASGCTGIVGFVLGWVVAMGRRS